MTPDAVPRALLQQVLEELRVLDIIEPMDAHTTAVCTSQGLFEIVRCLMQVQEGPPFALIGFECILRISDSCP